MIKMDFMDLRISRIMKKHGIKKISSDDYETKETTVRYTFYEPFSISDDFSKKFDKLSTRLDTFIKGAKGRGDINLVAYDSYESYYEFGLGVVIFGEIIDQTKRGDK